MEARVVLPPRYVALGAGGIRAFQRLVQQIDDLEEESLLLHAPTGAGKTHALRLWLEREKERGFDARSMLVIAPTNALAAEIHDDLTAVLGSSAAAYIWTAAEMEKRRPGESKHPVMAYEAQTGACIVANPDNLHRFTQHHYGYRPGRWPRGLRTASHFLANVGVVVVDEYHVYDEPVLASLLLLVMKLRRLDEPPKFIFMSATPGGALPVLLDRLGVTWISHEEGVFSLGEGRPIQHQIQLTLTNEPILHAVPPVLPEERTLMIFNAFTDVLRALRRLPQSIARGPEGVVTVTGWDTSRRSRSKHIGQAELSGRLMLATSKADVGLNIPGVRRFHVEPGWRLAQAWQRLGRAGRDGPADVTLHLDPQVLDDRTFERYVGSRPLRERDDVDFLLRALLPEESQNVHTVQHWMARYLAAYHAATQEQEAHRSVSAAQVTTDCPAAGKSYSDTLFLLTTSIDRRRMTGRSEREWHESRWQKEIGRVLGGLRGNQYQVDAHDPRFHADGETSRDDLVRLLRWTECHHDEGRWVVDAIREERADVSLTYPLFGRQTCPLSVDGRGVDPGIWRSYTGRLAAFPGSHGLRDFRQRVADWLRAAGPGALAPLEVQRDEAFI